VCRTHFSNRLELLMLTLAEGDAYRAPPTLPSASMLHIQLQKHAPVRSLARPPFYVGHVTIRDTIVMLQALCWQLHHPSSSSICLVLSFTQSRLLLLLTLGSPVPDLLLTLLIRS
jgi:hypothetical protein